MKSRVISNDNPLPDHRRSIRKLKKETCYGRNERIKGVNVAP